MADGLTPKQEAFCHAFIEHGGNASAAYREAYDADSMKAESVHVAACRLVGDPKVSLRIKELRDELAYQHKLTVADLLRELEEARTAAMTCETPQSSAAVAATMGKAKLLGYDKQAVTVSGPNGGPIEQRITVDFVDAHPSTVPGQA